MANEDQKLLIGKQHVHHTYIWLQGISSFFAIMVVMVFSLGPVVLALLLDEDDGIFGAIFMLAAIFFLLILIAGLTFGFTVWGYKHLWYEITPTEFNVYSGIINKKRVHVPYQRVQSVDVKTGLLQRLAGVCTVSIDTAGGASNNSITVPYVTRTVAEQLRTELFRRKKALMAGYRVDEMGNIIDANDYVVNAATGAVSTGANSPMGFAQNFGNEVYEGFNAASAAVNQTVNSTNIASGTNILDVPTQFVEGIHGVFDTTEFEQEPVSFERKLSNSELVLTGISAAGDQAGAIILSVITLIASFGAFVGMFVQGIDDMAIDALLDAGFTAVGLATMIILILIGVAILIAILSLAGAIFTYAGFSVKRRGNRVEVEQGLVQRVYMGVDVDRVQSITIRQGFIKRMLGYAEVAVDRVEGGSTDSEGANSTMNTKGVIIHPFIKATEVPEFLNALIPEFSYVPDVRMAPDKRAKRRAIIRHTFISNGGAIGLVIALASGIILNLILPFMALDEDYYILCYLINICWAICVACIIPMAVGIFRGILWHKDSQLEYNRQFMTIRNAGFSWATVIIPRKKIQFATLQANPLQYAQKYKTIIVTTAAATGTKTELWDLSVEDAETWLEWVRPRG